MRRRDAKPCVYTAIFILMALVFASCGTGKPEIVRVDPGFGNYVSAYSSGMQSRTSTIRVQLQDVLNADALASVNKQDTLLLQDIFAFEPEIRGKAIWSSEYTVEFIPAEPLPVNQFYDVYFDLERLAEVKDGYEDFHFQFATFQQDLFVTVDGLYDSEEYDLNYRTLRGTIRTSDFEDSLKLLQTLKVVHNGKQLPVRLKESYQANEYLFYVDSVKRTDKETDLIVTWDGTPVNAMRQGKEVLKVPALGDFSVSTAKVFDRGDQYVELHFTEPIAHGQDLNGIVTIDGITGLTCSIDESTVTVYLPNRTSGNYRLHVTDGIRNIGGHRMNKPYSSGLVFEKPKPMVRVKGSGSILPNSGGLIFPFEAIGLKSVDVRVIRIFEHNVHHFLQINDLNGSDGLTRFGKVIAEKKIRIDYDKNVSAEQWSSHVIDLNKFISADPGAIYRVSIKFGKEDAACDCPVTQEEESDEDDFDAYEDSRAEDPNWSEHDWHGWDFDGYESWDYYYNDDYSACSDSYYDGRAVSRNILASDLGTIFKLDEDKLSHVFVSNMITTEPVAGAEVQYFSFARELIASAVTDANGMAEVQLKEKPFLMITKKGKQRGYLKLGDGYTNSLSEFDIEGEEIQNGVKGYIYGERGVWRPGDSLYVNFILQDLLHALPPNHPVKFELTDPNGQTVYETTRVKHVNGTYDFRTATSPDAITGSYMAYVHVGNRTFTKDLRIETVKPNRLKIYMNVDGELASDSTKLSAKWLHGASAQHLDATVSVKVNQMETAFKGYKDYAFDSPIRSLYSNMETIFEGQLDDKGEAWVDTRLDIGNRAPGMLRAHYVTKVYEAGGDFSIDRMSLNYSPFGTYIGLRTPETDRFDGTLATGKSHRMEVVALNENGKPVNAGQLQVKIYGLQWRWWFEKDDENLADYIARTGTIVLRDTMLAAKGGKTHFSFKAPEYGRYLITVTDLEGNHQTGKVVTIDDPDHGRENSTDNERVNMLNFASDKQSYTKGEEVQLSFPSPADGRALVSVETSRKVVKKFWVKTVKGETRASFTATADMSPNAFIHVSLIQPHATTKNDLPIRMYGVIPISVDDPATHLHPEIAMAEVVRPETTANVNIREQNGRKMTYTLAVVDEGLLDLTAFKTPQPWTTFYAKEALGVRTWDIYDHVIGAYAGKLDKLLSVGGDGDLDGSKGPKANRFKPVVTHLGPFTLEAGASANHPIDIPNYVGSVRVMVVAQNEGAYGNAEKTVAVKKPLMVLATLPRVLGPGEQVQLPVDVFAMEKHVKNVKVTVEVNDFLKLEGSSSRQVTFTDIGDQVLNFRLNVAEKIGIAKVKVTAVCGKEKSVQEIELDVRAPNPVVFEGTEIVLEPGREWNGDLHFKGMTGTNKATIEFSSVPAIGLEKNLNYLMQYPHGCIEQTTSSVFPQLFADNLIDLNDKQREAISGNIRAGLRRLQLFQTTSGGFSYWPGEDGDSEWGTNYAGHFLLEAEQHGYSLPGNLKHNWVKYQQERARNWTADHSHFPHSNAKAANEMIQAYRLFVLALSKHPELGAMNRLREERDLSPTAKWRLAAAYQLVGQNEVAQKLTSRLPVTVKAYKELSYSYGSDFRDQAMILETLSLMKNRSQAATLAKDIAARLSSDQWMSTQETAYGLLAISEYADVKGGGSFGYSYRLNGGAQKKGTSKTAVSQVSFSEKDFAKKGSLSCKNTGSGPLFVKVMVQGIPLKGDQTSSAKDLALKLLFRDMDGNLIRPDKLRQGTDFVAEVTISNPGKRGLYKEMALTQIFPSGWEIHNARMDGGGMQTPARYLDIRDDRVHTYYDLAPNETKTFKIQLNATYLGRFYLPSTYSEAMYDHLIQARAPGRWVEVVREEEWLGGKSERVTS